MNELIELSSADMARITQQIERRPCLQEMIDADPDILKLLKLASMQRSVSARWRLYETLKRIGTGYVGWNARNPQLRAARFYEAYIHAIDALLPQETDAQEEGDYLPQVEATRPLRDTVIRLFPNAQLPGFLFDEEDQPA